MTGRGERQGAKADGRTGEVVRCVTRHKGKAAIAAAEVLIYCCKGVNLRVQVGALGTEPNQDRQRGWVRCCEQLAW
jgi:hypothetical protein